jgi:hypothetical protein
MPIMLANALTGLQVLFIFVIKISGKRNAA